MIKVLSVYLHPQALVLCMRAEIFNDIKAIQPIWEVHFPNELI